jgi:acylphosphatase
MRLRSVVLAALLAVPAGQGLRVDREAKTVSFEARIDPARSLEAPVAAREIHDAFREIGLKAGAPSRRDEKGRLRPPRGAWVAVLLEWEEAGARKKARLEELIADPGTKRPLAADAFLFVGPGPKLLALGPSDGDALLANPLSEPPACVFDKDRAPAPGTRVAVTVSAAEAAARRVRARVKGTVQGVGFRDFTQRSAAALRLGGWVKNLADGDVELVAEGPGEALQALLEKVQEGPPAASVTGVRILEARASAGEFTSFDVRY